MTSSLAGIGVGLAKDRETTGTLASSSSDRTAPPLRGLGGPERLVGGVAGSPGGGVDGWGGGSTQWLAAVADRLAALPVEGFDGDQLMAVVIEARRVRRAVEVVITRAGVTAKHRETEGSPSRDRHDDTSEAHDDRSPPTTGLDGAPESDAKEDVSFDDVMRSPGGAERAATVRRDKARAEALAHLPGVAAAVAAGRIGPDHLDAIARAWRRFTDPVEAAAVLDDPTVIADAERLPADTFECHLRRVVNSAMADKTRQADARAKRRASQIRHWFDEEAGMGRFTGQLDPERYEAFTTAIEQHMTTLANAGGVAKGPNLAATALVELVTGSGQRSPNLPHITLVVRQERAGTGDGRPVPPEAAARMACDAVIRRVTVDSRGVPIDVGRSYRTATDAQWAALQALYSTCGWDGCTAPLSWCQAHHIHFWEHDGLTDLCNLIPLCNRHHHLVHDEGWQLRLRADDRRLTILKPVGDTHVVVATTAPDRNPIQRE